jgi:hypothetical protein
MVAIQILNPYEDTGGKVYHLLSHYTQLKMSQRRRLSEDQHAFIVLGKCNSDDEISNRVSKPQIKKRICNKHVQLILASYDIMEPPGNTVDAKWNFKTHL